ncbi:MAG: dockerin type I domain-containing protein [Muribaculaceae bacterium]|nr:dockerin type I domain-containing protein [Muribaculaceae bacterium]
MNEDDVLDVSDVTSLINYLLGTKSLPDITKADINGDFEVNVSDVTVLINLILGGE